MEERIMRIHHLLTYVEQDHRRACRRRELVKRRVREDLVELERQIAFLASLMRQIRQERLAETTRKPIRPLTTAQANKRAERDQKRRQRIKDVQGSATERIAKDSLPDGPMIFLAAARF
jgi:hypothetical protein